MTRAKPKWIASAIVTLASLVLAFVVAAIIMVFSDTEITAKFAYFFDRPSDALSASWAKIAATFQAMVVGSVGSFVELTETMKEATPLIAAGLGVALAFRAGLFNIGAQGQALAGSVIGAYLGFSVKGLPLVLHLPLILIAAMIFGAVWGGLVGLIKARTGAHEVILTIMMNNIAAGAVSYVMLQPFMRAPGRADPISPILEWSATLPRLDGSHLNLGFGLVLLAAFGCWWLLERTKFGLQLQAVGINPDAAAVSGASVSNVTIITMALAGALAGLGGVIVISSPEMSNSFPPQMTGAVIGSLGFDALTVALLGRSRPLGVVLAGLLFGAFKASQREMQLMAGTPRQLTNLIQALIVLFVAAPAFVSWLLPFLRERRGRRTKEVTA